MGHTWTLCCVKVFQKLSVPSVEVVSGLKSSINSEDNMKLFKYVIVLKHFTLSSIGKNLAPHGLF